MKLRALPFPISVCKLENLADAPKDAAIRFLSVTPEEISLVCPTENVPPRTAAREDGWRGFYIEGVLDFSLVGVLSAISSALAGAKIGLFAVSTYNTDYVLVKEENFPRAMEVLREAGFETD